MIRTLSVEGGIMGDFNFLSKFSEMILCYFGIFKDILSSLRKTCPGDVTFVLFFFLLLSLTRSLSFPNWEMRVQQQGRKFLFSPSISFPIWANHFKDSPSLQVLWAVSFVPLICQEKGCQPVADPVLTKLPSPAFLT